jgi:hypothetical protein
LAQVVTDAVGRLSATGVRAFDADRGLRLNASSGLFLPAAGADRDPAASGRDDEAGQLVEVGLREAWPCLVNGHVDASGREGVLDPDPRQGAPLVRELSPGSETGRVASTFFVLLYLAISAAVLGIGVSAQHYGLRLTGLATALVVAILSAVCVGSLAALRTGPRQEPASAGSCRWASTADSDGAPAPHLGVPPTRGTSRTAVR